MATALRPHRFAQLFTPSEVVGVNAALPFASSIRVLWRGDNPHYNIVNGQTASNLGTDLTYAAGVYGQAADFSGSGTARPTFSALSDSRMTVVLTCEIDSVANLDRLFSQYNGAGSVGQFDTYYAFSPDAWRLEIRRSSVNAGYILNGLNVFSGTLAVAFNGIETPVVFLNGVQVSVTPENSPSGTIAAANNIISIGGRADVTTRQFDGRMYNFAHIAETLSREWLRELTLNPSVLWEPQQIWVPVYSLGGAPTLSDLKAVNVTGSSVQATIDYAF